MPSKVKTNIVDNRLLDNGKVVEDITSVALPTLSHPTTEINASGMVMGVDMPNMAKLDSMELSISHNNGVNGSTLCNPGRHVIELRVARQVFDTAQAENEYESVKYRFTCLHKSTDKGTVESGNPLGYTDKYSVLRYEEEIAGNTVVQVDATAGILKLNGNEVTDKIESILS